MCNIDMYIMEKNWFFKIKIVCEDVIIIFCCVGVYVLVFFCYKDKMWVFFVWFVKCIWDKECFILIFIEWFY